MEDAASTVRRVLMAVRVKGRADVAAIADSTGLPEADAGAVLAAAERRGEVRRYDARWGLTDVGRAAVAEQNATAPTDRAGLAAGYDEFLTHDRALKQAITTWQETRSPGERGALRAVASAATRFVEDLARLEPRYATYGARLGRALARLGAGDERAVASPGGDSLHQTWFELHEDLLIVLGRTRTS